MAPQTPKSKKRSAASSTSKPPDRPVLFLDISMGRMVVADALREVGANIVVHTEQFSGDTPDATWLYEVGARRWVVISKDKRIRYRPAEQRALRDAGVPAFFLVSGNTSGAEMAEILGKALARIESLATTAPRPAIYQISRDGRPKCVA